MKKFLFLFVFVCLSSFMFSSEIIDAAKNDDYKTFARLAANKKNLKDVTEDCLNVQMSLVYFSDENFEKACKLLSKKHVDFNESLAQGSNLLYILVYSLSVNKVETLLQYDVDVNLKNVLNGLIPIQALQFYDYAFITNQIPVTEEMTESAQKIKQMLINKGSKPLEYCPVTISKFGNFFFCLANILYLRDKSFTLEMLNNPEIFQNFGDSQRDIMAMDLEVLPSYLKKTMGLDIEIINYKNEAEITSGLTSILKSDDEYYVIGYTSKNKIAPFQWVNLDGSSMSYDIFSGETIETINPDNNFIFVDFNLNDFSQMIAIKVKK